MNESPLYRQTLLAVSYVLEHKETHKVAAYFTLANDRISLTDFKDNAEFNRFRRQRFVNEKRLRIYPVAKLCRLGVDVSMRGESIGTFFLSRPAERVHE